MAALHDIVKKGSTDRSVTLRIIDSADGTPETAVVFNSAGIDLWYRREGAARTAITEATLAALTTAHTDGGFLHISDGEYRLDLPDAAYAVGANHVDFGGTVTGMVVIGGRVRLVDYDPEDTVRLGLTALPNAAAEAAGGLYTRGTGAGQINQETNGRVDVNVHAAAGTAWGSGAITAASIGADAITDAKVASDVTIASVTGSVGSVTGAVGSVTGAVGSIATGGITTASFAAGAINAAAIAADAITDAKVASDVTIASVTGAVGSVTAGVTVTTNNDKAGYGLSAAAVQAIWDALTSALTAVGSIGKLLVDNINATISSRLASASYTTPPTVGAIADQVWEETLADHSGTAGSTAAALNAAGSAGDPWNTALPGAYGAGSAGKIIGDNINATISSRATPAQVATELATYDAPTKAELDAAVAPLATAANLATAAGYIDTEVAAIITTLGTPAGVSVSADIAAVKAQTAAIETDTQDLQTQVGTAGAGLTALGDTRVANLDATVSSRATPAQVNTEADTALADVGLTTTVTGRIDAAVSSRSSHSAADVWSSVTRTLTNGAGIKKNTALTAFPFLMVDDTDGKTPETGLTITAQRSLDGAAFASCANGATEVSNGWYKITLAAGDLNGDTVVLRFSATGARTREIVIVTEP